MRVLIVDDDADFASFLAKTADGESAATRVETDPTAFFEAFQEFGPDTIFLDIVMPEIDGIEIIRWLINRDFAGKVMLVSGYSANYAKAAMAVARADGRFSIDSLSKPVARGEVVAFLRRQEAQ